jgi:transcriptional regulator with XRE-family HTH domain
VPRPKGPIKSKLPPREIAICLRVREARTGLGLSQEEFSRQLAITRSRLASYEDARAPLKASLALKLCHQFIISEKWLATGIRFQKLLRNPDAQTTARIVAAKRSIPFSHFVARRYLGLLQEPVVQTFKPSLLFSHAYRQFLGAKYDALERQGAREFPRVVLSLDDNTARLKNMLQYLVNAFIQVDEEFRQKRLVLALNQFGILFHDVLRRQVPPEKITWLERLLDAAWRDAFDFEDLACAWLENQGSPQSSPPAAKKMAANIPMYGNIDPGPANLPAFLARLNQATRERGKKSALAKYLGVPPPKVSQWLAGDHEPGGETTLRMLQWLQQQERQP